MPDYLNIFIVTGAAMVLDVITGIIKAGATGKLSSKIGRQGLFHKVSLMCVVALAVLLEYAQMVMDLGFVVPTVGAVCALIVVNESISILENLAEANPEIAGGAFADLFSIPRPKKKDEDGAPEQD